jgi:hypothetical protein
MARLATFFTEHQDGAGDPSHKRQKRIGQHPDVHKKKDAWQSTTHLPVKKCRAICLLLLNARKRSIWL